MSPDPEYYVSDTPSVGDHVVNSTTTTGSAATTIAALLHGGYKVVRVNMSTGRGTARLADDTGKAVQLVRGRFSWKLADGTARSVRFAHPTSPPKLSVADGEPVIFEGDVNAGEPPFDQDMFQPVPLDDTDELWTRDIGWGPFVTDNKIWHRVEAVPGDEGQRAICGAEVPTDALVYDRLKQHTSDVCSMCWGVEGHVSQYYLKTVADVPFGYYPPYPEGPALVTVGDWCTSNATGAHIDGVKVSAFKVLSENPWNTQRHELDGFLFASHEEANRAKYEAGLIGYLVYQNKTYPTASTTPSPGRRANVTASISPQVGALMEAADLDERHPLPEGQWVVSGVVSSSYATALIDNDPNQMQLAVTLDPTTRRWFANIDSGRSVMVAFLVNQTPSLAERARRRVYTEGSWQTTQNLGESGYLRLWIDNRVRGYIELRTLMAFWEITPSSLDPDDNSFVSLAPRGSYPTVQHAQVALMDHVAHMDSVCDGRRGVQGSHMGCSPQVCKPIGVER